MGHWTTALDATIEVTVWNALTMLVVERTL
jgi:hypothetical protein